MRDLLQTVIPTVLAALVAGRVAVTRTGRRRKDIRADLDLLGQLPADHPSRVKLKVNIGELVDTLARRQRRRFGPFTPAGFSFGVLAGLTGVALAFAGFGALLATGVLPSASESASDPTTPGEAWAGAAFFLGMAGALGMWAARIARRELREHPPAPAQQPTEVGVAPD